MGKASVKCSGSIHCTFCENLVKRKYKKKCFSDHVTLVKIKGQIHSRQIFFKSLWITTATNHFDRPYIKGDIQLRLYCFNNIYTMGCLKITKKHPLFKYFALSA